MNKEIIGHILLTKILIKNKNNSFESLALPPVSVKPAFQKKEIGNQLIMKVIKRVKNFGYKSIVLLVHEKYYPKFGYEPSDKYNIELPFNVPEENCMVIALTENGLDGVNGKVEYLKEFYE